MIEFIEKLRGKPEHIRRRIVYVIVPVITLAIATLWFLSLGSASVAQTASVIEVGPTEIIKDDSATIWAKLKGEISDIFNSAPTQIPFR